MISYSIQHSIDILKGVFNSTLDSVEVPSSTSRPTVHPLPEHDSQQQSGSLQFILVPLAAIAVLFLVSGLVILYLRKRRNNNLRHHLIPLYNFDSDDEEWETELLDDESEEISLRRGYKSMEFPLSIRS